MHYRRKEILDDLTEFKAVSKESARYVFGSDYRLAIQMVKDKQLGCVEVPHDLPNNITIWPSFKFFITN
jgi:hypothetical protein